MTRLLDGSGRMIVLDEEPGAGSVERIEIAGVAQGMRAPKPPEHGGMTMGSAAEEDQFQAWCWRTSCDHQPGVSIGTEDG